MNETLIQIKTNSKIMFKTIIVDYLQNLIRHNASVVWVPLIIYIRRFTGLKTTVPIITCKIHAQ